MCGSWCWNMLLRVRASWNTDWISGVLVIGANAWMQSPRGYTLAHGELVDLDPLAVFANPSWGPLALHSTLACYASVGFAVMFAASSVTKRYFTASFSSFFAVRCLMTALAARTEVSGETVFFYTAQAQPLLLALQAWPQLRTLHRPANLEDLFLKLTGRQIREDA